MSGELLARVLGQSAHISALVKQSVEELILVNGELMRHFAGRELTPEVKMALAKNETVTRRLQDASASLTVVNEALQTQVRDRILVDHQLAAAVEQEQGSRNAALHDNLTGLPNRVLFLDRLEHGIAQATRHRWVLAVMFVDLDNFKGINDSYGHQAGDTVLQAVAMRLLHSMRTEDTVGRYAGDEFLCLLAPLHEARDIAMIAAKIRKAIQAPLDLRIDEVELSPRVEASIGIAVFPKDGVSAAALIKRADEAMYEAKQTAAGYAFA